MTKEDHSNTSAPQVEQTSHLSPAARLVAAAESRSNTEILHRTTERATSRVGQLLEQLDQAGDPIAEMRDASERAKAAEAAEAAAYAELKAVQDAAAANRKEIFRGHTSNARQTRRQNGRDRLEPMKAFISAYVAESPDILQLTVPKARGELRAAAEKVRDDMRKNGQQAPFDTAENLGRDIQKATQQMAEIRDLPNKFKA